MHHTIRQLIERHMNLLLFIGCTAGLAWPHWNWAPDVLVKLILIVATFIACFRLTVAEFKAIHWRQLAPMIVLRYTAIPWVVYGLASMFFSADVALGLLLISSVSAGVSSPAITHIFNGQVTLATVITLLSTLMVPLTMPLLFFFASGAEVMPDTMHLLRTLLIILVLPCALYACLRQFLPLWTPLKQQVDVYGKAVVVALTALMLAIVVGKQREFVLGDLTLLAQMVLLTFGLLSGLLLLGWAAGRRLAREQRIGLAVTSGFNNAALAVALAALHFGPLVVVITVAAEVAWAFLPFVMRRLIRK